MAKFRQPTVLDSPFSTAALSFLQRTVTSHYMKAGIPPSAAERSDTRPYDRRPNAYSSVVMSVCSHSGGDFPVRNLLSPRRMVSKAGVVVDP